MQNQWNKSDRRKTCPSGTSTTTDPTRTGLRMNPGLHDDRPCLQQTCILIDSSFLGYDTVLLPTLQRSLLLLFLRNHKKCQAKNEYTLTKSRVDNCSSEPIGTVVLCIGQACGHWKSDGGDQNGE